MDRLPHRRPRKPCSRIDRFVGRYICRRLAYLAIQMQIEGDRQNIQKQIEEDRKNIHMRIEEDRHKAVSQTDTSEGERIYSNHPNGLRRRIRANRSGFFSSLETTSAPRFFVAVRWRPDTQPPKPSSSLAKGVYS